MLGEKYTQKPGKKNLLKKCHFLTKHWHLSRSLDTHKKETRLGIEMRAIVFRPSIWNPKAWWSPYRNELKRHPRLGFVPIIWYGTYMRYFFFFSKSETLRTWLILRPAVSSSIFHSWKTVPTRRNGWNFSGVLVQRRYEYRQKKTWRTFETNQTKTSKYETLRVGIRFSALFVLLLGTPFDQEIRAPGCAGCWFFFFFEIFGCMDHMEIFRCTMTVSRLTRNIHGWLDTHQQRQAQRSVVYHPYHAQRKLRE